MINLKNLKGGEKSDYEKVYEKKTIKNPLQRHIRFEVEEDEIDDWEASYLGHQEPEDTN